jgi:hypothetical protein
MVGQVPLPVQLAGSICLFAPATHPADRQLFVLGATAHVPEAVQVPSWPQTSPTVQALSAVPAVTLAHLPVLAAHAWHVPQDGVEQQTLSTQLFEAHSVLAWHISPSPFLVGIFMHLFDDVLHT